MNDPYENVPGRHRFGERPVYGLTELPGPVLRGVVIVALALFWAGVGYAVWRAVGE